MSKKDDVTTGSMEEFLKGGEGLQVKDKGSLERTTRVAAMREDGTPSTAPLDPRAQQLIALLGRSGKSEGRK